MLKAVVFLADGFEEIEAVTVIDYLRRAEVDVSLVAVPVVATKKHTLITGAQGISVTADYDLDEYLQTAGGNLPDVVYVPGGMPGAANLGANNIILRFLQDCFNNDHLVAAICAAPVVILAKTGILAGRRYTCYPGMEDGLSDYCGNPGNMMKCMKNSTLVRNVPFITDGNLITGRGPGCAEQFAMEIIRILFGDRMVSVIKKCSICA
jgi:protein deglycase